MSDLYNNEDIERMDESMTEELPPEPKAPEAPQPNFTEAEGGYTTGSGSYDNSTFVDPDENLSKILAIVSLVTGIISLICCCVTYFSGILAIVAIVCGIISISKSSLYKGMAIAGIICGSIGIVIFVLVLLLGVLAGLVGNAFDWIDINDFL